MDLSPIADADMLSGLTAEEIADLGRIASEQEFQQRDCLFSRGEEVDAFYIAISGCFSLTVALRLFDRYTEIAVEEMGPLDAFGWSSIVKPHTSIYSAYCIESGRVVTLRRDSLHELMQANHHLSATLLGNLSELISARIRVVQDLWLTEASQSMGRVQHWMGSELTSRWASAMSDQSPGSVARWIRRHRHGRASE